MPDIKDLEIKPYKLPDDPKPAQALTTCSWCSAVLNEDATTCHLCGHMPNPKGQPIQRKPCEKGQSQYPKGTGQNKFVSPSQVVASKQNIINKIKMKSKHKNEDYAEHNPEVLGDTFTSDTINQCKKPVQRKNRLNDDIRKEEVMRSCEDLEIDG